VSDRIFIKGARFECCLGVTEEERAFPQQVVVDVDLATDVSRAASTDDIGDTVNYSEVWHTVRAEVEGRTYHLIEALAERVATALLGRFDRAEQVTVAIAKPAAAKARNADAAGVEVTRARPGRDG
jgi:dihydroneopterin aldolase